MTSVQVSEGGLPGEQPVEVINWEDRAARAREIAKHEKIMIDVEDAVAVMLARVDPESLLVEAVERIHGMG